MIVNHILIIFSKERPPPILSVIMHMKFFIKYTNLTYKKGSCIPCFQLIFKIKINEKDNIYSFCVIRSYDEGPNWN